MGRVKFQVHLEVDSLHAIPYQTVIVFCKVKPNEGKFLSGKSFFTHRQPVENNVVTWKEGFDFQVKMHTGDDAVALPHIVKISVRRETEGGSKHAKLGHVKIDVSEFIGFGRTERNYLLVSDDESHRQDNSTLKVAVSMKLIEGNPLVKPRGVTARPSNPHVHNEDGDFDDDDDEEDERDDLNISSEEPIRIVQQVLDGL
eukprot:m.31551 g.31551  ORF g.31551 m.31551 type:complete len:200 (+) comp9706_c0_seq1:107-706(+)